MTTDIKVYSELTTIQLFDWEIMTEATIDQLDQMLNNAKQFIRVWNEIVNKNQIKKIYVKKIDSLENFILAQPKDIQQKIKDRDAERYSRVGKRFETIEEVQRFIDSIVNK